MKHQKEPYLKIPAHILNLPQISLFEKMPFAYIYSFGAKGCWQSNQTLAQIYMATVPTICKCLNRIKDFMYVKYPQGQGQKLWSKSHPHVFEAVQSGVKLDQILPTNLIKSDKVPVQNCTTNLVKSPILINQKCVPTNNHTITDTKKDTIASPSHLPAYGQTPATVQYRIQTAAAPEVENFKANFGHAHGGKARQWTPLTPQQFEQGRTQQVAALRATQNI